MHQNGKEIRALTGLRGIAASWVVLYHFYEEDHLRGLLDTFITHGYMAVDIFFVLSGFVMSLSYAHFFAQGWSVNRYTAFLMRRFARIYPLYAFATCLTALLIVTGLSKSMPVQGFGWVLLANLLMIQSWGISDSIDAPAWSISTEFAAYLLFPLLAGLALFSHRRIMFAVLGICVAAICLLPWAPAPVAVVRQGPLDIFWEQTPWPLVRCISEFSLGLITYRLSQAGVVRRWTSKPLMAALIGATIVALMLSPDMDVVMVMLVPGLILALTFGKGILPRFLAGGVPFFLGEISYALYLLHAQFKRIRRIANIVLVKYFAPSLADVLAQCIFYGCLIFCSWLAYRLIEQPGRRYIRAIEERLLRPCVA